MVGISTNVLFGSHLQDRAGTVFPQGALVKFPLTCIDLRRRMLESLPVTTFTWQLLLACIPCDLRFLLRKELSRKFEVGHFHRLTYTILTYIRSQIIQLARNCCRRSFMSIITGFPSLTRTTPRPKVALINPDTHGLEPVAARAGKWQFHALAADSDCHHLPPVFNYLRHPTAIESLLQPSSSIAKDPTGPPESRPALDGEIKDIRFNASALATRSLLDRNRPSSKRVVQQLSLLPLMLSPPLVAAYGRHCLCYGPSIHTTPSAFRLSVLADETSASSGVYDFSLRPAATTGGAHVGRDRERRLSSYSKNCADLAADRFRLLKFEQPQGRRCF
ncbi:uncharacterized protein CLUP02_14837 [Colletotrichum lupini]|uniref:Uncharacterized protein n=1 Tax=Colletotrichum lupini TaxID=145971 RepID=A0A9Q8T4Z2_9PEZI|nr:uncharacterized protein CLUP02_14837 [Colletotrichum lupini]UQC89308.1 hypothetical protein CLUP02_14837 [Colletotrichum lupini]